MPIIIGDPSDPHVEAVANRLSNAVIFDAVTLADQAYVLDADNLHIGDFQHGEGAHARGWVRRLAPSAWGHGVPAGSHTAVGQAARLSLLAGVLRLPTTEWLTGIDPLMVSESKLVQARAAAALGVRTPRTLVTGLRDVARSELGRHVVVKPLGPGQFTTTDGTEAVVFAQLVDLDDADFRDLGSTPFLIQEAITARRHFRAVTVSDEVWVAELAATSRPLDWRSQPEAHHEFVASDEDEAGTLAPSALSIARRLELGYTSQDWVEDEKTGEHVLLDVNPGGQWLFLPEPIAGEVADALATWLEGTRS